MSTSAEFRTQKPQIAPKPKLEYDKMLTSLKHRLHTLNNSNNQLLQQQQQQQRQQSPHHHQPKKASLSLLEEIYAEIEDKHAKSSLLKTLNTVSHDYSCSSSCYSSNSSSAYSSYSSCSSSSCSAGGISDPPPPLPNVPPPPLTNSTPNGTSNDMTLQQEIEKEICSKLDTPFVFQMKEDLAASTSVSDVEVLIIYIICSTIPTTKSVNLSFFGEYHWIIGFRNFANVFLLLKKQLEFLKFCVF
jgi:hypothetical protein